MPPNGETCGLVSKRLKLQLVAHVHMDSLDLGVRLQSSLSKLTTNAALLHTCFMGQFTFSKKATTELTSKWDPWIAVLTAVDPDHTSLNFCGNAMSTLEILREQR